MIPLMIISTPIMTSNDHKSRLWLAFAPGQTHHNCYQLPTDPKDTFAVLYGNHPMLKVNNIESMDKSWNTVFHLPTQF